MNTPDQWLGRIASYLSGNSTAAEREELERWLENQPEQRAFFEQVKRLWELEAEEEPFETDVPAAWTRLNRRLDALPSSGSGPKKNIPRKQRSWGWAAAAAVLLLLGTFFWLWDADEPGPQPVVVQTAAGEQADHRLPDGTRVWLNASSRLRYRPDFEARSVQLSGEAYFEVVRDEQRPFVVQAPNTQVAVLGTAFNLRAYPGEEEEQVAVASGKVAVRSLADTLILSAGEASVYQSPSRKLLRQPKGSPNALSWHTGIFQYKGTPLAEALPGLERYYGVSIELENQSLGRCPLNGRYENEELEVILTTFALATGAEVQRQDRAWIISGKGCR